MKRTILFLVCSVVCGLAAWAQLPKADVMDLQFNADGTVTDVSAMQNPVTVVGSPRIVKSELFNMNVLCQSDEQWGAELPNFVRVDANEQLEAAIADGVTLETMIRPYFAGGKFNREWVNLFGGFQGGGIGLIIYNGVYDFEAYIGGYVDVVNNFAPVADEWIHLMGVWNKEEGTMKLFINGKLEGALSGITGEISFANREDRFYAVGCDLEPGNSYHSGNAFTGDIALARIYDKPLTDEEVAAVYDDIHWNKMLIGAVEHDETPVLRTDDDGTVLIATEEELSEFGRAVRLGNTELNAKLEADITYSKGHKMLSTDGGYTGTFDGQGHTITMDMEMTGYDAALFKYLSGATIKNLGVKGDITTSSKFAAGVVGRAGGSNRISKVHSSVNIISSIEGDGTHGGLVGAVSSGATTIEDCLFDGSITGELTSHCAGLVGWSGAMSYIYNSLMIGEITTSEENSCVLSRNPVNARVYNCYYTQPYGSINDGAIQLDDNQLINGEACWLLNGSKVSDNWRQTLPADEAPTLQTSHGIVVNMDGDIRSIQDEASLKEVCSAYATYLNEKAAQTEAYKPLIDQLKTDISQIAAATTTEEFLSASQTVDSDVAAIEANQAAYAAYAEAVESAFDDVKDMSNPVALLLKEYLIESVEPNDNFPNGSSVYIIENYALGTEELQAEMEFISNMLQNALSNDVPVGTDVTLLLTNADFSKGDEGWDGTNANNYTSNPNSGQWYGVFEATKTQTITGLKNGLYEFRMNGFNMIGDDNYCSFYTGVILANDVEIPVMSPMEDPVSVEDAVQGVNCYGNDRLVDDMYYIPYSRQGGAVAMAAGRYQNSVMVEVTDGTLTVGAHLYGSGKNDDWFMFANAKLYYQGTQEEASEALDNVLAGAIARATTTINYEADAGGNRYLYFPNYSKALRDELTTAVETAQAAADGPSKYAALVKLSDLFKQIYTCRKAYRQMAIDVVNYYDRIRDYPEYVSIIQSQADEAWDAWLAGAYTAEEALAKGQQLLAEMDSYFVEMPVADLLDIAFNDDGSATDVSATHNEVITEGVPKVVKSPALDMNVFCHTQSTLGDHADEFFKVIPSDAFVEGISDGMTFEVLTRPYWTDEEYASLSWASVLGMEESGGAGMLVYNNQWCFEAHVGGGYKDAYSNSAPVVGEWVHLVGVWDNASGSLCLYVNGSLAGSTDASGSFRMPNVSSPWLGIGCDLGGDGSSASYKGDIALARIYNEAVNSSQVALLYKKVKAQFTGLEEHSEGPNAVQSISASVPTSPTIYTLTGMRIEKPTRGIYIINGKKVLVK